MLLLGFLLSAVACERNGPLTPDVPLIREVVLAPGEAAEIGEVSLSVRFTGVSEDSRCPAGTFCVWAGDGVVQIDVDPQRGVRAAYTLHTGDTRPARHGDVTIELVELAPYPVRQRTIQPAEYRARLRIIR